MEFFTGLVVGWISCVLSLFIIKISTVYRLHKKLLVELTRELKIINEIIGSKLKESEGEFILNYELLLPDNAYKKAMGSGTSMYLNKDSLNVLKHLYSEINMLNKFFEVDEVADPHKLYSVIEDVSINSLKAEKFVLSELKEGVYSSFFDFMKFHIPAKGLKR